jgi:hypothetical protein
VNGDAMEGVVKITLPPKPDEEEDEKLDTRVLPWKAQRVPTSPFFAPVGIPIFDRK